MALWAGTPTWTASFLYLVVCGFFQNNSDAAFYLGFVEFGPGVKYKHTCCTGGDWPALDGTFHLLFFFFPFQEAG